MSIPQFRVIRDEEAPIYDGLPIRRSGHITMIDDDVVERIATTAGPACLGLYVWLERRANKDGNALGSYQDFADTFSYSRRQLIRIMDPLIKNGWVKPVARTSRNGAQVQNIWHLPFHGTNRTYRGDMGGDMGGDNDVTPKVVSSLSSQVPIPPQSPQGDDSKKSQRKSRAKTNNLDGFDEWYAEYPRHTGFGAAQKSWARLSEDDRVAAVDGLRKQLPGMKRKEKQFICMPSTWLNQRRWMDDPDPQLNAIGQPMFTLEDEYDEIRRTMPGYAKELGLL